MLRSSSRLETRCAFAPDCGEALRALASAGPLLVYRQRRVRSVLLLWCVAKLGRELKQLFLPRGELGVVDIAAMQQQQATAVRDISQRRALEQQKTQPRTLLGWCGV